jgi:hypothetical protein
MRHIARSRGTAAQWRDLLAALARGEAGPGGQVHQRYALAGLLGGLHALRQPVPPQVVVVIDEIGALAEEACGPLGADLARRLEKGRSVGVAVAVVGSRPTATWIT